MDRHLAILANGFRVTGCVLGALSTAALLFLIFAWATLNTGPQPDGRYTSISKYGIVGFLQSGAYGLGKVFKFFGELGSWLAGILAVVAFLIILFSVALFFTGRGLQQHATWARLIGGLMALLFLMSSSGLVLGLPREGAITSGVLFCASAYALWVLGWRFS